MIFRRGRPEPGAAAAPLAQGAGHGSAAVVKWNGDSIHVRILTWPILKHIPKWVAHSKVLFGCGPSLCRYFATLQRQGQQTLPLGQLHMSPCLKVLVFLAPQCGSARAPHRRARTVALGSCGAEKLVAVELRSWERGSCGAGKLRKRHKGRAG